MMCLGMRVMLCLSSWKDELVLHGSELTAIGTASNFHCNIEKSSFGIVSITGRFGGCCAEIMAVYAKMSERSSKSPKP